MRVHTRMKMFFLVLAGFLLLPVAAQASVSLGCGCTDNDQDGYGDPASQFCDHPELDCDDAPSDDPPACASCSCGTIECGQCARCIHPGAIEVCDGVDNDCDGLTDEEPDASASCDDQVSCPVAKCTAGTCECGPVAITLIYFTATPKGGAVQLAWGTGTEIESAGFNVLRSGEQSGPDAPVNPELIPAKGGPTQGADYTYTDSEVEDGAKYWYKLQEVETGGATYIYDETRSVTLAAGGCSAEPSAEAATIGTSKSKPVNALYPLSFPLLLIAVWLGRAVYRRRR